jgi:hypothetical protein
LLIGGALAIRFLWSVSDVSTARLAGSGKPSSERAGGPGTLLGPEGTGTRGPRVGLRFVRCLQAASAGSLSVWGGWLGVRAGPAAIPRLSGLLSGLVGCWWWLWVGVRSCFENCIVNASIL